MDWEFVELTSIWTIIINALVTDVILTNDIKYKQVHFVCRNETKKMELQINTQSYCCLAFFIRFYHPKLLDLFLKEAVFSRHNNGRSDSVSERNNHCITEYGIVPAKLEFYMSPAKSIVIENRV